MCRGFEYYPKYSGSKCGCLQVLGAAISSAQLAADFRTSVSEFAVSYDELETRNRISCACCEGFQSPALCDRVKYLTEAALQLEVCDISAASVSPI